MSESIENFLDRRAGEGRPVSEGHFTISGERAFRKLAEFSVSRPEQWVLKWVQGAVAGKAEKIEFVQSRRGTVARAWLESPLSLEGMEAALLGMRAVDTPFWREVVIGLRALLIRGRVSIVCGQASWGWDGSVVREPSALPARKDSSVALEFVPESTVRASWQCQDARELQNRCGCGRTPIWLNSVPINSPQALPRSSHPTVEHGIFSPRLLAVGWLPWDGRFEADPEIAARTPGRDRLRCGKPFLYWPEAKAPPGRTLAFRLFYSHGGRESLVDSESHLIEKFRVGISRYGVLCGAVETEEFAGLGGEMVVEGDGLRTDFSGLGLERGDDWWNLLRLAFIKFSRPLRDLIRELNQYQPESAVSDIQIGLTYFMSGMAAGALIGLIKGGPVGVVLGGTAGAFAGYNYATFDERELISHMRGVVEEAGRIADRIGSEGLSPYSGWRRTDLD